MKITADQQRTMDALADLSPPMRKPGDIDIYQISENFNISENGARDRMKSLVKDGKFIYGGLVFDTDRRRTVQVWRVPPTTENDNKSEAY